MADDPVPAPALGDSGIDLEVKPSGAPTALGIHMEIPEHDRSRVWIVPWCGVAWGEKCHRDQAVRVSRGGATRTLGLSPRDAGVEPGNWADPLELDGPVADGLEVGRATRSLSLTLSLSSTLVRVWPVTVVQAKAQLDGPGQSLDKDASSVTEPVLPPPDVCGLIPGAVIRGPGGRVIVFVIGRGRVDSEPVAVQVVPQVRSCHWLRLPRVRCGRVYRQSPAKPFPPASSNWSRSSLRWTRLPSPL